MTSAHAPVPMTALLAHRAWVRRLARSLVRDDASADDLEQRTWVAAMRSPPASEDAARPWLARVVRRLALDSFRAQGRRDRHERSGARGEAVRSAADVVAEAETQKRVVAAVCALAEPYRTTVLLRFFEDLPPREVARRLGVPVETVRTRQKRAAEMLRRELGGTDGSEWLAALTPLLAAPREAASTLGTTGGVVMKASTKTGLVVLAVAAVGAFLWLIVETTRDGDAGGAAETANSPSAAATEEREGERRATNAAATQRKRSDAADDDDPAPATSAASSPTSPAGPTSTRDALAEFERNAVVVTSAPRPSGRAAPLPTPWSADDLLELLSKKAEPALPLSELADDAAAFARCFVSKSVGATVDPLTADPATPLEDGTRLLFPPGCHRWDAAGLAGEAGRRFPQDLVIEGAGMDETLVVLDRPLVAEGKVGVITFRDLTVHSNDSCVLYSGVNVVRLDRVRVIGFDGGVLDATIRGRGAGQVINGRAAAVLAQDCRFESGFGNKPGEMWWFLGTSPGTSAQSGWLTIARFERCRFAGPLAKPPTSGWKLSIYLPGPPAAVVYSHCDLVDATPVDREFIEHAETTPPAWSPLYVRFEDCRVTNAPDSSWVPAADAPPRKRRDVSELNPAWRMPEVPAPK
jgi:RNA polymerase sigma-70 factor (ECF subfamily)